MKDRKNASIKIRLAEYNDAPAIAELLYESFIEYRAMYTEKAFAVTTPRIVEIKDRIGNKIVWVALYNNRIAGTVSIKPRDERLFIRSMAVLPIVRKKGIGKELLKHAEKIALKNNLRYLELTTTPFLADAIRLYESLGFGQNGYDDLYGTSLIRMIKNLKSATISIKETQPYNN